MMERIQFEGEEAFVAQAIGLAEETFIGLCRSASAAFEQA